MEVEWLWSWASKLMIRKANHVVGYLLTEEATFIITLSFGIFGGIESVNINIEEVWVVY